MGPPKPAAPLNVALAESYSGLWRRLGGLWFVDESLVCDGKKNVWKPQGNAVSFGLNFFMWLWSVNVTRRSGICGCNSGLWGWEGGPAFVNATLVCEVDNKEKQLGQNLSRKGMHTQRQINLHHKEVEMLSDLTGFGISCGIITFSIFVGSLLFFLLRGFLHSIPFHKQNIFTHLDGLFVLACYLTILSVSLGRSCRGCYLHIDFF